MLTPTLAQSIKSSLGPMRQLLEGFHGKSIFITGANGLIPGTLLASLAIARKEFGIAMELFAFCHHDRQHLDALLNTGYGPIGIYSGNLAAGLPASLNDTSFDYVVHGASLASPRKYLARRMDTMKLNVLTTLQLLEKAHRDKATNLLYIGSGEIYGNPLPEHVPTPEVYLPVVNHLTDRACYTESKRFAESLCMQFSLETGQTSCSVRPVHVFGPGLRPDDGRVVADFLANAVSGTRIVVKSDGSDRRAFCYSLDANLMLLQVLLGHTAGFDAFNIGNPHNDVSIAELARSVAALGGVDVEIQGIKPASSLETPARSSPDISKLRQAFGNIPLTSLEHGLKATLDWMRENPTLQ